MFVAKIRKGKRQKAKDESFLRSTDFWFVVYGLEFIVVERVQFLEVCVHSQLKNH